MSDTSIIHPSITPDTLLEFTDLNHSFLQYYCIHGEEVDWYGRLGNLGTFISTPLTLLCPPELTEILGINNFDTVSLSLAAIPPLKVINLQSIKPASLDSNKHLEFTTGLKASKGDSFIYKGHLVTITSGQPATGFITPSTHIEDDIIEPEPTNKQLSTEITS
ncbi:MAG: hypothetical protein CL666_10375 [Balneola sp.]|nr:hypothetical protein [Balneola sp.]|tara:strand:+ start:10370 stop:10858 length:489 start_codon:yes stop_codon:yes gene_type:complete